MRTGTLIAITAAVVAAAAALYVFGITRSDTRMQQQAGERQQHLFAAIRTRDVDAVRKIVRDPVDIYATDVTGESALSLAEQSGNRKLLEALGPRRDREADLLRANRAAEFGYGIGLRPPPVEPEFNVGNFIRDEAERARSYEVARREIDIVEDAAIRDSLHAQLAGISGSRGLANLAVAASSSAVSPATPKVAITAYDRDRSAFRDLQGTWVAGNVTQNGKLHLDRALMSSTWIFRADDLYIDSELPQKTARQFTVEVDRRVRPHALRIASVSPADRSGWMIFSREGSDLKVAFYPDFGRRPASFDAQDGLVVVRLTPTTQSAPVAANDGCAILRAAGAYDLPGVGTGEQSSRQFPNGGFECRVFGRRDVHLLVNPASTSDYEQRIRHSRGLKGYEFRDEGDFGARTYSMTSGGNLSFVAFKDGKIVQLNLTIGKGMDPARLRQIFGRVLEHI